MPSGIRNLTRSGRIFIIVLVALFTFGVAASAQQPTTGSQSGQVVLRSPVAGEMSQNVFPSLLTQLCSEFALRP